MIPDDLPNNEKFPELKAETLSGKKITFPSVTEGKYALILMAFRRGTQPKVDSWLNPFIGEFGAKPNVTFYEIPMISGGWKIIGGWIDSGMRQGVPEQKHDHVATYYGPLKKFTDALNIDDLSGCYVFLLNPEGEIIWRETGWAEKNKLEHLFKVVNEKTE